MQEFHKWLPQRVTHTEAIDNYNNYKYTCPLKGVTQMKQALTVVSWISIVLGFLAVIGGLTSLSTDPQGAYYALMGGALFAIEGILAVAYVNQQS